MSRKGMIFDHLGTLLSYLSYRTVTFSVSHAVTGVDGVVVFLGQEPTFSSVFSKKGRLCSLFVSLDAVVLFFKF